MVTKPILRIRRHVKKAVTKPILRIKKACEIGQPENKKACEKARFKAYPEIRLAKRSQVSAVIMQ